MIENSEVNVLLVRVCRCGTTWCLFVKGVQKYNARHAIHSLNIKDYITFSDRIAKLFAELNHTRSGSRMFCVGVLAREKPLCEARSAEEGLVGKVEIR